MIPGNHVLCRSYLCLSHLTLLMLFLDMIPEVDIGNGIPVIKQIVLLKLSVLVGCFF